MSTEPDGGLPEARLAPKAKKPLWRRALVVLIELVVLGGIAWVLFRRRDALVDAFQLGPVDVVVLLLLCLAAAPVRAIELSTITATLGARLPFWESFTVSQAATLLNYLPMQAGTVLRARVLKAHKAISYTRYVAIMTSLIAFAIGTSAVDGLATLPFTTSLPDTVRTSATLLFGAIIVATVVFLALPVHRLPAGEGRLARRLRELLDGWHEIRRNPRTLLTLTLTAAVTPLLLGLRYWVCFRALSHPLGLPESLLFGTAVLASIPVNVTPGGLGVRELVGSAIGAAAGLAFTEVLAVVSIDRVISLLYSLLVGGGSLAWLRRRKLV